MISLSTRIPAAFENDTFIYRWRFKINANMEVSKRYSHYFQLKVVSGFDCHPMLTISGAERNGEDGVEVRYSPLERETILRRQDWDTISGEWLEVYCRVNFSEIGYLRMFVTRISDASVIFDIDKPGLKLWRGEHSCNFVRPKWGICSSILDRDGHHHNEKNLRFSNFSVSEVIRMSA